MRKSKKQLLRTLIACGLVVSVAAGGTVAYLPGQRGAAFRVTLPLRLERSESVCSSRFIFFMEANKSRISLPEVGAHEPFSMSATVRFCKLWACRSRSTVSMLQKIPAL